MSRKRQVITFTLDPGQVAVLDYLAAEQQTSRSAILRQIIPRRRKLVSLRAAEQQGRQFGKRLFELKSKRKGN